MAHIYIYSPSGAVRDKVAFRRGLQHLKQIGHEVEVDAHALSRQTRFAGDDDTRVEAVTRACASGADVALMTRGGYGLTRILPRLPYKQMHKAVRQGMRFVGLSDFTALQNAVLAKNQTLTWAGPALGEDFGAEQVDDIMQACFDDLLEGVGEGAGWRLSKNTATVYEHKRNGVWVKDATLWGGNLSVLVSLLGTPYFPQIQGGVLFIEDIAEHPYRVERMLTQLLHAGVLAKQKAIIFGQFNHYKLTPHDAGFKLETVQNWLRQQIKAPVLTDLPFGHVQTKVCLPVGAKVDLLVEDRDVLLLWGHPS
jgi:muramoyltetrapeptide carboxypeptidase